MWDVGVVIRSVLVLLDLPHRECWAVLKMIAALRHGFLTAE